MLFDVSLNFIVDFPYLHVGENQDCLDHYSLVLVHQIDTLICIKLTEYLAFEFGSLKYKVD